MIRLLDGSEDVASLPVQILTDPPLYRPKAEEAPELAGLRSFDYARLPITDDSAGEVLLRLLASPNIASKRSVYLQYDHQVQTNTVTGPGGDAAILRIPDTSKGFAMTSDGNARLCYLDPFIGGTIAVSEACRNLSCVGATPVAISNCLNFGDPEKPDVYYQLEQVVRGMSQACETFGIPVISGNVSLYNETQGKAIYPTPVIGAVGLLEEVAMHVNIAFRREGDVVVLLGSETLDQPISSLAGSEYLELYHNHVAGAPTINLDFERRLQECCRRAIKYGILTSAHDCSDGGLAVAIAESCMAGQIGIIGDGSLLGRWDAAFFGESQSRIVVSLPRENLDQLKEIAEDLQIPFILLGSVGGTQITLTNVLSVSVEEASRIYENALEHALQ